MWYCLEKIANYHFDFVVCTHALDVVADSSQHETNQATAEVAGKVAEEDGEGGREKTQTGREEEKEERRGGVEEGRLQEEGKERKGTVALPSSLLHLSTLFFFSSPFMFLSNIHYGIFI